MATLVSDKYKLVNGKVSHELMVQIKKADIMSSARHLGYGISRGVMYTYKPCAEDKAKHKSPRTRIGIIKTMVRPKTVPKELNKSINLDISMIKEPAGVNVKLTKPQCLMVVDESTEMKWSNFFETRNRMVYHVCHKFHK